MEQRSHPEHYQPAPQPQHHHHHQQPPAMMKPHYQTPVCEGQIYQQHSPVPPHQPPPASGGMLASILQRSPTNQNSPNMRSLPYGSYPSRIMEPHGQRAPMQGQAQPQPVYNPPEHSDGGGNYHMIRHPGPSGAEVIPNRMMDDGSIRPPAPQHQPAMEQDKYTGIMMDSTMQPQHSQMSENYSHGESDSYQVRVVFSGGGIYYLSSCHLQPHQMLVNQSGPGNFAPIVGADGYGDGYHAGMAGEAAAAAAAMPTATPPTVPSDEASGMKRDTASDEFIAESGSKRAKEE